jgi:nucleoside-diphosphate-sugar epimerase
MNRILITGANSFVGRYFIRFSENKDIDEISLFENKPEEIDFHGYNVVIHLVAIVHQSARIEEREYNRINRELCISVAVCAKDAGVKHFIFLSTVKVYGRYIYGSGPWNEFSDCFPEDSYGKSKYEAEVELRKMETKDFTVSIIRTPLVYGVGVKANMLSILKLVDRFPILPLAKVMNRRSFTFAENLVAFIDRIIERNASGVFIAMDDFAISTTDLVNIISKYLDKKVILFRMPEFFVSIGRLLAPKIFDRLFGSFDLDNSATLKTLDFKPPYTTEHGIEKMVLAYKEMKINLQLRDN